MRRRLYFFVVLEDNAVRPDQKRLSFCYRHAEPLCFDAKRFAKPSVEDIEFGGRLARSGGRILLDPGMLCTHHKRWSFREVLRTDCLRRALPWSHLLARDTGVGGVVVIDSSSARWRADLSIGLVDS